jgi:hypothetical protein
VIDPRRWAPVWPRPIAVAATFTLVTAATCLVAYPAMFGGFAFYDDEGYLLISLQSYMGGGSLYDEVFTQYGPFYYELWGGAFSLFGIGVSHDNARLATIAVWVLSSLLIGAATYRVTRSVLLGAATQALVFVALSTVTNEPMHPGALTCLLVAFLVAAATAIRAETARPAMALTGAILGALVLVKVNIGAFALAALVLTCAATYPTLATRRWFRRTIEVGFVLTPLALMTGELDQSSVQRYCAHVTIAAAAVVILLRHRDSDPQREPGELAWLAAGFLIATFSVCAAAIATGSSSAALFEGVISRPIELPDVFVRPLDFSDKVLLLDLLALLGAVSFWRFIGSESAPAARVGLISLVSVVVGVQMSVSVVGFPFDATAFDFEEFGLNFLALAWVALIPLPGAGESRSAELAGRLLPPLAVLQGLHAYPVAGSQLGWSAFLLAPVGAICVANGVRGLRWALDGRSLGRYLAPVGLAAALALIVFVAETTLRRPYDAEDTAYERMARLELPGSDRVRLLPAEAHRFRRISATLNRRCSTFVSLPGLNSFYLWSGREPPTALSPGDWMFLLNDEEQRRVVAATASSPHPCLLKNDFIARFWAQGRDLPDGPLLRFIQGSFTPVSRFGAYELGIPVGPKGPG